MSAKATLGGELLYPSKYLSTVDLKGRDWVLVIAAIEREELMKFGGKKQEREIKPILRFRGATKAMVLNKTNVGILADLYGPVAEKWVGKSVTVFEDKNVMAFGKKVSGLRIRESIPKTGAAEPPAEFQAPPDDSGAMGDDSVPFNRDDASPTFRPAMA